MAKVRLGTAWLDACSGCHMSLLDLDEAIVPLAGQIEVVYSPLVDAKELPDEVDIFMVSGSVSTDEDVETVRAIRGCSKLVAALGDCAVTGNVPSLRNRFSAEEVLRKGYLEDEPEQAQMPREDLPRLLEHARPLHHFIQVDAFIQGCPPAADLIGFILHELVEGRAPGRGVRTRFG